MNTSLDASIDKVEELLAAARMLGKAEFEAAKFISVYEKDNVRARNIEVQIEEYGNWRPQPSYDVFSLARLLESLEGIPFCDRDTARIFAPVRQAIIQAMKELLAEAGALRNSYAKVIGAIHNEIAETPS